MYICEKCGNTFDEPKELKNMGGDIGESVYVCPYCGHDEYAEAIECAICGDIVKESDSHECVCDKCIEKNAGRKHAFKLGEKNYEWVDINGCFMQFFDSKEINQILTEVLIKRFFPEEIEEKCKEYCLCDPWEFAKYLKKEGVYL